MRSIIPLITAVLLPVLSPYVLAAKGDPAVTKTRFDSQIEDIFYFDDSNTLLAHDGDAATVYRSEDAGETWKKIDDKKQAGHSWGVLAHPWDNQRAYIIGEDSGHWMTKDQGKTWKKFDLGSKAPDFGDSLTFHGRDPKKVIWNGENCSSFFSCSSVALYTDDDFETAHPLGDSMKKCYWAVGTAMFAEEVAKEVEDRVFCIEKGVSSSWSKDNKLVVSDDYFHRQKVEPALDGGRAVSGVVSMVSVKKYLVAAAKSEGTDELALYVTDDSSTWHRAEFGQHRVNEEAYTVLESTNYSMQIDVMGSRPSNPMGYLFTSNSNGTYFTKNIDYTNRSPSGKVDFEKVSNIQGIVLVNVVDNHEEVAKSSVIEKDVVSQISFDDGRTFHDLTVDGKRLHLHSVTDARQYGKIFSSPAPGIVMGIGNVGKSLNQYTSGHLYVSDDAGLTWTQALKGPYLYEFGNNGAVLVAVSDEMEETDSFHYSLDHGKEWTKVKLETGIRARLLTTVPDSTTLKFLLAGTTKSGSSLEWIIYKIDFAELHERTCKDADFEKWPARVDGKGEPSCVMGHKQFFRRRKADADCFIDDDFKDPAPEFEPCVCTEADFECDFNFVRSSDRKECIPSAQFDVPKDECKNPDDKYMGSSGYRLIPGNECIRKNGVELDKKIERPCSDARKKPATDEIATKKQNFKAAQFQQWFYLQRSDTSTGDDETIIIMTDEGEVQMSRDHGKKWEVILEGESIRQIIPNPHFHDAVFFLTRTEKVYYTIDRGETFHEFKAPDRPSKDGAMPLKFHPDYKDWLLWAGTHGSDEHTIIHYSSDRGDSWKTLARYAKKCDFMNRGEKNKLIYCTQYEDENPNKRTQLVSSSDFFDKKDVIFSNIVEFTTMAEFIIVAQKHDNDRDLKVDTSLDGHTFAEAEFPKNFQVQHQQAYTVLDSSTHAVFLHVTVNTEAGNEYGSIIKSNSNGTSYVLTLSAVNRDEEGYVDFEKMQGLEGVAMVNVVSNIDNNGGKKKLKSMITHNDGAEWALIPPPKKDSEDHDFKCVDTANVATEKCSLHIHSYTERSDKSATFSSSSAVGVMMAVGNVGESLSDKGSDGTYTFITRDAGITWTAVKQGSYLWEYGDQGSVIVIVSDSKPVKSLWYTLDEGKAWQEYQFSDVEVEIGMITTLPSDNSLNFLLWGRDAEHSSGSIFTLNVDFSGLKVREKQCTLDEEKPDSGDYELWSPKHPLQTDNCLFGHIAQYHRKRLDADCFNGKKITHLHNIAQNCTCTRQDFECDYNFQTEADGTCRLVPGLSPSDHQEVCAKPGVKEFWEPSGYRKIPLSTCEGGRELDKIESKPCPGHEKEYAEKHGIGAIGVFFAIIIPIAAAGGIGYWVYKTYLGRGFGGFGQIRLGENLGSSSPRATGGDSPLITIPVAIISGVVAVTKALPLLASSLFRSAKGYMPLRSARSSAGPYRSRDAFANRRNDYAGTSAYIEDDELLGQDDEDADADEV